MVKTMDIKPEQIYTEKETAEYLRKKPASLASGRCRKDFALPWVRIGRRIGYLGQDILDFVNKNRVEVPAYDTAQ
jgi:orotate phosphoribosyltransferase-like protein